MSTSDENAPIAKNGGEAAGALERRSVPTSEGEVWIWGRAEDFAGSRPLAIAVTGAFAGPGACRAWPVALGRPMVIVDLPGNRCPWLRQQTPAAFSQAISEVVVSLKRPVVLCGVSTGGTVALGAEAPNLRAVLALDPMLSTDEMEYLWPGFLTALRAQPSPELAAYMANFFGLFADRPHEARRFWSLLKARRTPAWVFGADKVGPQPGIHSTADVAALKAAAGVRYTFIGGVGHQLTLGAAGHVLAALRNLLDVGLPALRQSTGG